MVEIKNTWGPPADNDIGVDLRDKRAGQLSISLRLMRGNELVQIIRNAGKRFVMEGVNDKYEFALKKSSEKERWALTNLQRQPTTKRNTIFASLPGSRYPIYGIMVEGDLVEILINSPEFKVLSAESVSADDFKQQLKVVFRSRHMSDPHNTILGGTLTFSPKDYWVLCSYNVEVKSDTLGPAKTSYKYQDLDGLPFPKDITLDYKFEGDPPIRYHLEFGKAYREKDKAAFYLTAYGIPEPADIANHVSFRVWWIAICIAGLALCTAALVFRKVAGRGLSQHIRVYQQISITYCPLKTSRKGRYLPCSKAFNRLLVVFPLDCCGVCSLCF